MLQTLGKIQDRFSDLAEMVFNRIMLQAGEATRVEFVGDQYPEISIKKIKREKRGSSGRLTVNITGPQQFCPRQWEKVYARENFILSLSVPPSETTGIISLK